MTNSWNANLQLIKKNVNIVFSSIFQREEIDVNGGV